MVGFMGLPVYMCHTRGWEGMGIELQEKKGTQKKRNASAAVRRPGLAFQL